MTLRWKPALLLTGTLFLVGCTTSPNQACLMQLTPGKTTLPDVKTCLGDPKEMIVTEHGNVIGFWSEDVVLGFNPHGVYEKSFGKEVTTKTPAPQENAAP